MRSLILITLIISILFMANPLLSAPTLKWELKPKYGSSAATQTPAVSDEGIIFFSRPNDMKFFAAKPDGSLKWEKKIGPNINSSPAIGPKGTVYIGGRDNKLCAVNPEDGSIKWYYPCENKINTTPAIARDGTIYVSPYNKKLHAIKPDGTKKWVFEHSGFRAGSSPSIGKDETVYLADMALYAINSNGNLKWKYDPSLNGFEYAPAIGADGTIYVGSSYDGSLHAVSQQGEAKWIHKPKNSSGIFSTPAIGPEGTIYIGKQIADEPFNIFYAINPEDGSTKWKFRLESNILYSPTVGKDGTIYLGVMYKPKNWVNKSPSAIYALNSEDGSLVWKYPFDKCVGGSQATPTIVSDGTLYIGSLYALQTNSKGLANSPWPIFHHDQKNSGQASPSQEPVADLKANNSNGPITISSKDSLSITASLYPHTYQDRQAEYWFVAFVPNAWYYLNKNLLWQKGFTSFVSGRFIKFSNIEIPNPPVRTGKNFVGFVIDDNPDGDIANDKYWFDLNEVNLK